MRRIATFEQKLLSPGAELATEVESGNVLTSITIKAGGTATASGTGTVATDGPYNWIGRPVVKVGGRVVVDMLGSDWRHLSAFLAGGYGEVGPAALATGDQVLVAHAHLPFNKMLPRACLNGRNEKITVSTRLGAVADLGTTATAITGNWDIHGYTSDDFDPEHLWFEPHIRTVEIPLVSSTKIGHAINFAQPEIILGLMFRQMDESLHLTDPNTSRPDHLVKRITIARQKSGRGREVLVPEMTWSQMKQKGVYEHGLKAVTGQLHRGVCAYTFDDPYTPKLETAYFGKNDQLHVSLDTTSPIDPDLVLAGSSSLEVGVDKCYVTVIGFRPMGREYEADERGSLARSGIRAF